MNNFFREGNEYFHVGVLDGDLLKDLYAESWPTIFDYDFVKSSAERFLSLLRDSGYVVVQGPRPTVVEVMQKEIETYEQLKASEAEAD